MASGMSAEHIIINMIRSTVSPKEVELTDDEVDRGLGGGSGTACEYVLDGGAGLQTHRAAVLPPSDGAPLGVYETLLEDIVEDVLEVEDLRGVTDVDKLCGDLLVRAGRLVVGDPELAGSLDLGAVDLRAVDLRAMRCGGHICVERKKGRRWSGVTGDGGVWRSYGERLG